MRQPENTKQHKITFVLFFIARRLHGIGAAVMRPSRFQAAPIALLSAPLAAIGQRHICPF